MGSLIKIILTTICLVAIYPTEQVECKERSSKKLQILHKTHRRSYKRAYTKKDFEILMRCVSSESGSCYSDAYRVAQVILNRSEYMDKSITEVVYQKKQFSGIGTRLWNSKDKKHMSKIRAVCRNVIKGRIPRELKLKKNILYFMNPKTAQGSWAAKMRKVKPVVVSVNNHHYYEKK